MRKSIFKAYDVRGKYPEEIDEDSVVKIVASLTKLFGKGRIVIGRDARLSSDALYGAAAQSLKKNFPGSIVIHGGLMTTPMLYFLVNHFKAALGIMITASHNPKEFNGIKVVLRNAMPVGGKELESLVNGSR